MGEVVSIHVRGDARKRAEAESMARHPAGRALACPCGKSRADCGEADHLFWPANPPTYLTAGGPVPLTCATASARPEPDAGAFDPDPFPGYVSVGVRRDADFPVVWEGDDG